MSFFSQIISMGLIAALSIAGYTPSPTWGLDKTLAYNIEAPSYTTTNNGLNQSSAASVEVAHAKGVFDVKNYADGSHDFINYGLGYSFTIPDGLEVVDMADATYRATLANDTTRLEVFRQDLPESSEQDIYLSYSNQFLDNTQDFTKTFEDATKTDNTIAHFLAWEREKFAAVEGDQNYFGLVDYVVNGTEVYCFLFSSEEPIESSTLASLYESIKTFGPSVTPRDYPRFAGARTGLNEETQAFYNKYFSEDSSLSWGMFDPQATAESTEDLTELENDLDYHFDILLHYNNIQLGEAYQEGYAYNTLQKYWEHGSITELTLQTQIYDPTETSNAVFDILNGDYDDFLHSYAAEIASFGHPVLFRPFNEMNGDWCTYSAHWAGRNCNVYVELYRYIYNIFEEEGANANTLWIWNPNEKSFPNYAWNAADNYYPGDEYVDIVGITGYNTGDFYEDETWRSFNEIYAPLYAQVEQQYKQPLMITEFASASHGGDKAEWVEDMFKQIKKYPRIKVAVWWDGADRTEDKTIARNYYIDENDEILDIFRENLPDQAN